MTTDFKEKFYDLTGMIQGEFDRNLDMYGDKIQCRKGCSKCCSQIFRITQYDAWIISEHLKSLPEDRRNELKRNARNYIEKHKSDKNRLTPLKAADTSENGLPCPALGSEGECTIYEARPVICRRFGMPIYDYKNPGNIHACELNFKDGEEIADDKLIPNQTVIGKKWDELKDEFLKSNLVTVVNPAENNNTNHTTIAEAIANS